MKHNKQKAAALILSTLTKNVNLEELRGFILEAGVNYLDDEKGGVRAKGKRVSFLNNLIGFLDEVKVWQENEKTLR